MNEILKIFSNEEFVEIRIINPDGKPWFVAKDIAEIV
jgi:prophage antirepressor-like protein